MDKFKNSVIGFRLTTICNSFRETIFLDYSLNRLDDGYYLNLIAGSYVPEVLISSIVSLGFFFSSVSIEDKESNRLRLIFYLADKDI